MTKEFIKANLLDKNGKLSSARILKYNIELDNYKIYNILNDMEHPNCVEGHELKFISFSKGYSHKCINTECNLKYGYMNRKIDYNSIFEKVKKTKIIKYGDEHYSNPEKRSKTITDIKEKGYRGSTLYPKHNTEFLDNKQFIIDNFLDENTKLKSDEFMKFFNCKINFMRVILRNLDIKYNSFTIEGRITKEFIDNNLIDSTGKLSQSKLSNYNITSKEVYLNFHNISEPKCIICDNKVTYYGFKRGFSSFCSTKCKILNLNKLKNNVYDRNSFILKAKEVHGDKYDYSMVDYTNSHDVVSIICPEHGIFEQIAYGHTSGNSCVKCSYKERHKSTGWSRDRYANKPTILYYIKVKGLYKIGVTSRSISERFGKEDITIIHEKLFEDGREAFDTEFEIIRKFKEYQYKGDNIIDSGNTELFTENIDIEEYFKH